MPLSEKNLQELLNWSKKLAREAGDIIKKGSLEIHTTGVSAINEKKNSTDLVTKYDILVEKHVKTAAKKRYPDYAFMGEEETGTGKLPELKDGPTFCVDPIDGTANYVHGFDNVCISIGLIDEKKPVLGVIYNPFLDHLYYGAKGLGSFLVRGGGNPEKLPIVPARPLDSFSRALINVGWGSNRDQASLNTRTNAFIRLVGDPKKVEGGKMAQGLRSIGSSALSFAMVAAGQLDIYWDIGIKPWDICAGAIIAQEAGGLVNRSNIAVDGDKVTGDISDVVLMGEKYVVIRGIPDRKDDRGKVTSKGVDMQKMLVKEFCKTVGDWDP